MRKCLKANGLEGAVWQEGQRIYLETEQTEPAIEAVKRVFGLVSLSPVNQVTSDLAKIEEEALRLAVQVGLGPGQSFRVEVRRADKTFPLISPEVERQVGAHRGSHRCARRPLRRRRRRDWDRYPTGSHLGVWRADRRPGRATPEQPGAGCRTLSSGIDSPVAPG